MKYHCGLCDKDFELQEGYRPHIDGMTGKPTCGDCIRSIIYEIWGKHGQLGKR